MALHAGLFSRIRLLVPELVKFGVVGGIGSVIDLGGAAVLHSKFHVGPLESKAISVTAATVFTYLGSRFWTFKNRENQAMGREAVLFVVLNVIGLLIAEAVLGVVTYAMSMRGQLEYNAASLLGTGLGTIFRFYAYRKWVFLAPAQPARGQAWAPSSPPLPDYPPWELDPAFLAPAPGYSSWEPAAGAPRGPAADPPWGPAAGSSWEPAAGTPRGPAADPPWGPAADHPLPQPAGRHHSRQGSPPPGGRAAAPLLTATATAATAATAAAGRGGSRPQPAPLAPRAPGRHRRN